MLNPKEFFRFNATTREKKPLTTRGRTPIDSYPPTVDIPIVSNRVITPTREKEMAPPPTQEEVRAANAGEYAGETRTVKKVGGNKGLKILGAVGLTAGAGVIAYHTVPAVHEKISPAYHATLRTLRIEKVPEVPSNFNVSSPEGVIGNNNILRGVSKETIQKMPQFNEKGEPLLLVATPKEGQVSKFTKELRDPGIFPDIIKQAEANNIKDNLDIDNIAANTDIPMPIDGYAFSMVVGGDFVGIKVEFLTPKNTLDFVNIDANDIRIQALINAPEILPENSNGRDYQKGLFVKRGTPIFRTLVDGMTISYFRQGGENGTLTTNRRIPGDIVPLTIPHPTTGENKLPAQ